MANQNIHQGDLNDHSIRPTWGTIERQDNTNNEDRLVAIAERINKTVEEKGSYMDDMLAAMGLTYYDKLIYVKPNQGV